ncbi:MAG: cytochrome c [Gammaproteobacteria bacterium]|nr:cytochrome c [Gammaproteobacteria bacterium]
MNKLSSFLSFPPLILFASFIHAQDAGQTLTYNGAIGRIINENCVVCHQEGGIGPMQFQTYDQVRPWAPLIQLKVASREMPPYAYDHGIGLQDLIGDWRLDQKEIDQIVAWVEHGAPLGDPDLAPPPYQLKDPDEWNFAAELGQPDLVVPSSSYDIPASGNDLWSREFVDSGVTTNRCIKAVQVKPRGDASAVVHHANSSVYIPNGEDGFERYGMLTEYAMGKWGEMVPEGVCRTLPAGAQIQWNIHMFPGGVGATAQGEIIEDNVVEIGLWFHDEGYEAADGIYKQDLAQYDIQFKGALTRNENMVIPPNGYGMTQGFHSFDHPVRIDSFQPHGHLRMNAASFEIFYPDTGRTEQISQVSKWSATWHHSHIYEPEVAPLVPAGAVLVLKQWYDNTANNPNNPDPDQWVYGGSRTGDEMSHAWLAITHLDEKGYEKLVAQRKEREASSLAGND